MGRERTCKGSPVVSIASDALQRSRLGLNAVSRICETTIPYLPVSVSAVQHCDVIPSAMLKSAMPNCWRNELSSLSNRTSTRCLPINSLPPSTSTRIAARALGELGFFFCLFGTWQLAHGICSCGGACRGGPARKPASGCLTGGQSNLAHPARSSGHKR